MSFFRTDLGEGARIALKSLNNHRLRTVLTTAGTGIGVATLLAIVGIIQGLNSSFDKQLQSLGPATLYVSKQPWVQMGNWWEFRGRQDITRHMVEAVREQSTFATAVAPIIDEDRDVSFGELAMNMVNISGTTPDYLKVSGFDVTVGRMFTETEDDAGNAVAVLGVDVAETLFPHSSPLGASVHVAGRPFLVIGVLSRKGKILDESQDNTVIIPLTVFRGMFKGRRSHTIGVAVASPELLDAAEDELVGIMRRVRQTPPDKPDDFAINRADQLATTYQQLTSALYGVAVAIGFITLLVGGIGIMNIMLVSVRERTREIGVRRALGARKRTIVVQFILEAMVVSAVGGLLGTAVGLLGAKIVSWTTPLAAVVHTGTVVFGVLFASAVGLIFGIWPAVRAANLDPVEALRHE